MIKISATKLRQNLFEYLDKANAGEIIVVQRNNREVARLVSVKQVNWRDRMTIKPAFRVSPEKVLEPLEDIWEEYV